jgi:hypothetical protein
VSYKREALASTHLRIFRREFRFGFFLAFAAAFVVALILNGPRTLTATSPRVSFFLAGCFALAALVVASPLVSQRARRRILVPDVDVQNARRVLVILIVLFLAFSGGLMFQGLRTFA